MSSSDDSSSRSPTPGPNGVAESTPTEMASSLDTPESQLGWQSASGREKLSMKVRFYWSKTKDLLSRNNVQLTIIYAACFGILGATLSGMGPSLPELGRRTGSTDEAMGWALGVRAFGYFLGSMGGPLYDYLPGNRVLMGALAVCSVSCMLMGVIDVYWILLINVPFQGICMGLLDTGGNVMTLWLHPVDPEPYMQSLHFAFAIGGLISPLLIGQIAKHMAGSITVSWLIIAGLFLPMIFLLTRYDSPKEPPRPVTADGQTVSYKGWPLLVLILTAAFLFFDIGAEAATGTFLVTYMIRRGLSTETTATLVNSLFWFTMVIGRLIAIPVSVFVKSHYIILTTSTISVVATAMWLIFYPSLVALVIAMGLFGFGMSVAFATGILLAQYYIPISGRAGTMFVVGAASGEMVIPALVSQLFSVTNYLSLPAFMLGSAIVCLIIPVITIWAGEKCPKTMQERKELDIQTDHDQTASSVSTATSPTPTGHNNNLDDDTNTVKLDFELEPMGTSPVDSNDEEQVDLDL